MDSAIRNTKLDNKEKVMDAKENANKTLNESIDEYKNRIRELIEDKGLPKELFKQKEKEIAKQVM